MPDLTFIGHLHWGKRTWPVRFTIPLSLDPNTWDDESIGAVASVAGDGTQPQPVGASPSGSTGIDESQSTYQQHDLVDRRSLPPELLPHPGRQITMDDIDRAGSDAERWVLLAQRFPWNFDGQAEVSKPPATMKDIRRLEKQSATVDDDADLDDDLAIVEVDVGDLANLIDDDGQLIWGGQTRIAEALGIENAGTTNRQRILAVQNAIELNSTSTTAQNAEEFGSEPENGREAA